MRGQDIQQSTLFSNVNIVGYTKNNDHASGCYISFNVMGRGLRKTRALKNAHNNGKEAQMIGAAFTITTSE